MKKTTLIVLLSLIASVLFAQTYPKTINVGTTANDGTGDKVRTAFQKVNDNFTDIYSKVISGPVNGTKYTDLRSAVKYVNISPVLSGYYYYIKRIKAGIASGGNYVYRVEIAYSARIDASSSIAQGVYNVVSDSLYTVQKSIQIVAGVVPGGISGTIVIDFSLLTTGTDYQCSNFNQGGIFVPGSASSSSTGGGGGISAVPALTDGDVILGTTTMYSIPDESYTYYIDTLKNIRQPITLSMSKNDNVISKTSYVKTKKSEKINTLDSIPIRSGDWVTIIPDSLGFIMIAGKSPAIYEPAELLHKRVELSIDSVCALGTKKVLIERPLDNYAINIISITCRIWNNSPWIECGTQNLDLKYYNVSLSSELIGYISNSDIENHSQGNHMKFKMTDGMLVQGESDVVVVLSGGTNPTNCNETHMTFDIIYYIQSSQ